MQVLHTDGNQYGTNNLLGDSDFYANIGSANQPGCLHNFCDHTKAIFYYYASIFSQYGFIGSDCAQLCSTSSCISRFGLFNDGVNGRFCFGTTVCFPYALQLLTTTTTTTISPLLPPPPLYVPYPLPSPVPVPPRKHKRKHRRRKHKRCCRRKCRRHCRCCTK